jgi:hypothetical protein
VQLMADDAALLSASMRLSVAASSLTAT